MLAGMALQEFASELDRQAKLKVDYVVGTPRMQMMTAENGVSRLLLDNAADDGGVGEFKTGEIFHSQLGLHLGVGKKLYEKLQVTHPDLFDHLTNQLLAREPATRMVRTLDGRARAFLSNRYRRIDNYDLAQAVLPVLSEFPSYKVVSANVTERKMYLKVTLPDLEGEIKQGDVVRMGFVIQNSEVGHGQVAVYPLIERLVCSNGLVLADRGVTKRHVGRRIEETDESLFSDATLALDDAAYFAKVKDTIRHTAQQAQFDAIVADLRDLTATEKLADPVAGVERLRNRLSLSEEEGTSVLTHLIEGGDLTAWGALNAVTRSAQDVDSYDRSQEIEQAAAGLVGLSRSEWASIAA